MTHEERKQFGKAVKEARIAKGWSVMQLLGAVMLKDPMLHPSPATILRLENGGLTPSEEAKGLATKDTKRNEHVRAVVAEVLGISIAAAVAAPKSNPAPVVSTPESKPKGMSFAQAARAANRAAGRPQGRSEIPKMVKFYTSLTTDHGFSLGAIRTTLRQLTALGISTEAVRGEIKKKFADYIDTLEL